MVLETDGDGGSTKAGNGDEDGLAEDVGGLETVNVGLEIHVGGAAADDEDEDGLGSGTKNGEADGGGENRDEDGSAEDIVVGFQTDDEAELNEGGLEGVVEVAEGRKGVLLSE